MKITHHDPDLLILDYTPWILGGIFAALILGSAGMALYFAIEGDTVAMLVGLGGIAFGAIFLVAFVRRVQLVLDRPGNRATLRRRDAIKSTELHFALSDLRRAEVQMTIKSGSGNTGPSEVSRAALVIASEPQPVPLTLVYSSGPAAKRAAAAINAWLDRPA